MAIVEKKRVLNNYSAIVFDMSTTTIQVRKETRDLLELLKKNYNSKTYDDAIKALVRKKTGSMYGALAKGKKISFKEMMKGLRDKHDRY